MPYKPENDISENVVQRNSHYENLNGISCCTCSKCIKDDKSGTLRIYNFKSASPIVNPQSVGSDMIFFSNYMMPSGSYSYTIDPVKTKNNGVNIEGQDFNYASSLTYYAFRNCTGVAGSGIDHSVTNYPICLLDSDNGEIIQYSDVYYTAKFCSGVGYQSWQDYYSGYGFVKPAADFIYNSYRFLQSSMLVYPKNPSLYNWYSSIEHDNFYGNYLTRSYENAPDYYKFLFNNTTLIGVYSRPLGLCKDFSQINSGYFTFEQNLSQLPSGSIIDCCKDSDGRYSSYPWVIPHNFYYQFPNQNSLFEISFKYMSEFQGLYYHSNTSNAFERSETYYFFNIYNDPVLNKGLETKDLAVLPPFLNVPSSITSYFGFNPASIQSNGPNSGYLRAFENGYLTNIQWMFADFVLPPMYASATSDSRYGRPCSQQELQEALPADSLINKGDPRKINIGNYQDFFNYCKTHDYSTFGFRINNNCENNIEKMMHPIYILDLDGFVFPYEHDNYYLKTSKAYATNKFLAPYISDSSGNPCKMKYEKYVTIYPPASPDKEIMFFIPIFPSWINYSTGYDNYTSYSQPDFQPILEPDYNNFAKGGYILKNFNYYPNGRFSATIGTEKSMPVIASDQINGEYKKFSYATPLRGGAYDNCFFAQNSWSFSWNVTVGYGAFFDFPYMDIWDQNNPNFYGNYYKMVVADSRKLDDESFFAEEFYGSNVSLLKYFYFDSVTSEPSISYNGIFSGPSYSQSLFINYESPCGNNITQETYIGISDYVATVGPNTYQTNYTDSSGVTTVTIHNALFVGKKLFEANYENSYGNNRPWLSNKTKVPLNYKAELKGGFECDMDVTFRSVPICKMNSIPDKMKRCESIKVKMENYNYINQPVDYTYYWNNYYSSQNPYVDPQTILYYLPASYFNNYIFCPPDLNPNAEVYLKRNKSNVWSLKQFYEEQEEDIEKTFYQTVTAYNYKFHSYAVSGRMYGNDYPEEYKSSFYVKGDPKIWSTGNKVRINAPKPLDTIFIKNTDYYCIFIKDVKDQENAIDYCQIRIAETLSDAENGIYIEIKDEEDKAIYAKNGLDLISFTVKYFDNMKNVTKDVVPGYSDFYPQNYEIDNPTLDNLGLPYTYGGFLQNTSYGKLFFTIGQGFDFENNLVFGFANYGQSSTNAFPNIFTGRTYEKMEVISLSPLKIKFKNFFIQRNITSGEFAYFFNYNVGSYNITSSYGYFGFYCDLIIEEVVDENTIPSLPNDFNRILEMANSITTQNPYQDEIPFNAPSLRNPEKCKHIGKVIDRKDCNCPKKWIRQCDLHETTDWKKCMGCPNFEPDED